MLDAFSFVNDTLYDGLPYALICLSFVLTAKYIRFPDVTCAGSFVFGAAISAITIVRAEMNPIVGVALAIIGGVAAGAFTGFFYTVLRLDRLLSGILSTFVLYSINVMLLTPTIAYATRPTLFSWFEDHDRRILLANLAWHPWVIGLLGLIVLVVKFGLDWFLQTEVGLALRCLEDEHAGEYALERNGLAPGRFQILALCLGNAIVAATGALVSFKEGAANAQRGFDILITGLVAFLLGEQLLRLFSRAARRVLRPTTGAICGALAYYGLITLSQRFNIPSEFTKIALVGLVALSGAPRLNLLARLAQRRQPRRRERNTDRLLQVEGLSFRYASADKDSLQSVSFAVHRGQVVQLTGGNGAGKTTALRVVAGFLEAQERGHILFDGVDLSADRHERLRRIEYIDQSADRGVVGCLTTQENLALAAIGSHPSAWRGALRSGMVAHIATVVDRSPFDPDMLRRRADQLSGGQRQVLNLLTILAKRRVAELVLLDEPTNNLDAENTERCRRIIKTLNDEGAAIVIVSHSRLDGIEIDQVVEVNGGHVSGAEGVSHGRCRRT